MWWLAPLAPNLQTDASLTAVCCREDNDCPPKGPAFVKGMHIARRLFKQGHLILRSNLENLKMIENNASL